MSVLSGAAVFSLVLSFILDLIFNLIMLPLKMEAENQHKDAPWYVDGEMLYRFYKNNRPGILRSVPVLDLLVQFGSDIFYIIFSVLFLIISYLINNSVLWTIFCLPGLLFGHFIIEVGTIAIARSMVRRKMRMYE